VAAALVPVRGLAAQSSASSTWILDPGGTPAWRSRLDRVAARLRLRIVREDDGAAVVGLRSALVDADAGRTRIVPASLWSAEPDTVRLFEQMRLPPERMAAYLTPDFGSTPWIVEQIATRLRAIAAPDRTIVVMQGHPIAGADQSWQRVAQRLIDAAAERASVGRVTIGMLYDLGAPDARAFASQRLQQLAADTGTASHPAVLLPVFLREEGLEGTLANRVSPAQARVIDRPFFEDEELAAAIRASLSG
jgi:hypothetical protein